jgi:putative transposase
VKRLCRVLGVARSGFYAWSSRPPSARSQRDAALRAAIVEIHRQSRRTYGSPRIHAELRARGQRCSRKRVARLMGQAGLVGVHPRRHRRPLRATLGESVDLVNRDFTPQGPDRLWAADVTQFRTGEGWLHVAAVLDLWSRRVVGWSMGTTPNAALVSDALLMAFQRRRPDHRVVHHSDRGAAYTSLAFSQRVAELEMDQSLGSTGDCYDCEDLGVALRPLEGSQLLSSRVA